MIFTISTLKDSPGSADTHRVGKNHAKGNRMKYAVIIAAITLVAIPATAAAETPAERSQTKKHVIRCRDTATDPAKTTAQREYACNPTGADRCDGPACAKPIRLAAARRFYLHPEEYDGSDVGAGWVGDELRTNDQLMMGMVLAWTQTGSSLPPVAVVPTSKPDPPKAKPVWKCTKKRKGKKRKCHKVTPKAKPAPTPYVPEADDNLPATSPHLDTAKAYAGEVAMLVTHCQRTSVTWDQVLRYYNNGSLWTTQCSVLYYDKLRANRDNYNAQYPAWSSPYPSRLIVQQIESAYLRHSANAAETANLDCWIAWGLNTAKPLPTGCQG